MESTVIGEQFTHTKYEIEEIRLCNHTTLYPYGEKVVDGEYYFFYMDDGGAIYSAKMDEDDTAHKLGDMETKVVATLVKVLPVGWEKERGV